MLRTAAALLVLTLAAPAYASPTSFDQLTRLLVGDERCADHSFDRDRLVAAAHKLGDEMGWSSSRILDELESRQQLKRAEFFDDERNFCASVTILQANTPRDDRARLGIQ